MSRHHSTNPTKTISVTLPKCHVQANDDYYVCYVMEYDDEEHMDIDERYHNGIVEVMRTCRICGECDVYYPV